ncbi:LLM class F420-dependent oxidoreductase [Actinospica durhamensis]|uniref:LLM class F420-dependent oxidoreductase n=1 Tax=Actinospica durhamensis TaxID=1508375 RepID=A0A941EM06_9ACTN|nr:LLM class F420-dependent oxidoreductase [Actinospica durhamensis]MBR7834875.1 LLM class F420-dependent oxidoreductase [Actinospica durhamensis]
MTDTVNRIALGPVGVWRGGRTTPELAVELERLGYSALWVGSSPSAELADVEALLDATETLVVATGIVNIWKSPAAEVARSYHRIAARHPDRFLLGIGAGHREATAEFARPYEALTAYLDVLDEAGVPKQRLVLAALGPRVLRLAAERTAGAHPYLVTPEHTRQARQILGPEALLAPEHKLILDTDPASARAAGTSTLRMYLGLNNYVSNLRRLGFTEDEVRGDGSDRLFDAVIANGDADHLAAAVRAHLEAGADHVPLQVIGTDDALPAYRELASALKLSR